MSYKNLNDFELLSYVAEGNEDANSILMKKYQPIIHTYAIKMLHKCQTSGLELSDLEQEGRLGLTQAIDNFIDQKDTSFYTYAITCIKRAMISAVISSRRLKHKILNDSISLDDDDVRNELLLKDNINNPENILIDLNNQEDILKQVKSILTTLEEQVFQLMIDGFNYREIALFLDKDPKSIDNTIQRIKRKLKDLIEK